MDDAPSSLPLTIKNSAVRDAPDATATYLRCSHYPAQSADMPQPVFSPPTLAGSHGETR
jgi:hypothetical protein